jgi:hypothetical protein
MPERYMRPLCKYCGAEVQQAQNYINRALREGRPMFCNRICAGLARRLANPPTEAERKAAKAAYDARRRELLAERIKAEKRAYYQRTRDPIKEAAIRKERMHLHVEYCRRPEYKAWKAEYDRRHRACKQFGEFAEAFLVLQDLDREIGERATNYEIRLANGTINKAQQRRRAL